MEQAQQKDGKKNYPLDTTDGYQYLDDSDEALGIETKTYDNKRVVKRAQLSDGRFAVIRELNGKEVELSTRIHEGKQEKVMMAMSAIATTIASEAIVIEDLEEMRAKDYNKIRMACAMLNF